MSVYPLPLLCKKVVHHVSEDCSFSGPYSVGLCLAGDVEWKVGHVDVVGLGSWDGVRLGSWVGCSFF